MAWTIGSSNCKASTGAEIWIFIPAAPNAWKQCFYSKNRLLPDLCRNCSFERDIQFLTNFLREARCNKPVGSAQIGLEFSIAEISLPWNANPLPLGQVRCLLDTLDPGQDDEAFLWTLEHDAVQIRGGQPKKREYLATDFCYSGSPLIDKGDAWKRHNEALKTLRLQ